MNIFKEKYTSQGSLVKWTDSKALIELNPKNKQKSNPGTKKFRSYVRFETLL